mmetsp:Transcript_45851/g.108169  ORF Transcript_45851/g.108169 Transcript_45851/m.108169 type:complete len:348 (-) Transcript_45851:42-1085(-)
MSAYTLMQHNGWGEVVPSDEQVLNPNGDRGGIACFATDWHASYRSRVLAFIKHVGLGGLETDGQYENAPCADVSGDHHHNGLAGSWTRQFEATQDFNVALKSLNVYQTGADAYAFSGANKWNHADTDAGYALPSLWEKLTVGRMYVYDSTSSRLPTSGGYGVNDLSTLSKSCGDTTARRLCFDYGLASFYANGVIPTVHAPWLWDPTDADANTLERLTALWAGKYAEWRRVFLGHEIHLRRPDSRHIEATVHLSADNTTLPRALVALFNPTNMTLTDGVTVPLYYAGLTPGTTVVAQPVPMGPGFDSALHEGQAEKHVVGGDGEGPFDVVLSVSLRPMSYSIVTLTV